MEPERGGPFLLRLRNVPSPGESEALPADAQLCRLRPSYFGQGYNEPTGLHNWAPESMGHLAFQSPIGGLGGSCRLADCLSLGRRDGGDRNRAPVCMRARMRVRLPTAVACGKVAAPAGARRRDRDLSRLRVEARVSHAQLAGLEWRGQSPKTDRLGMRPSRSVRPSPARASRSARERAPRKADSGFAPTARGRARAPRMPRRSGQRARARSRGLRMSRPFVRLGLRPGDCRARQRLRLLELAARCEVLQCVYDADPATVGISLPRAKRESVVSLPRALSRATTLRF